MTTDEFIDQIIQDLTVSCALPNYLDTVAIHQQIEWGSKWFFKNYYYSTQSVYYYIPRDVFKNSMGIDNSIKLPCEVYAINKIYLTNRRMLMDFGIQVPILNISGGYSTQPYIAASLSTIGDLASYRVSIDNFADMLRKLRVNTVKFDFNHLTHTFRIMTNLTSDLLIECEVYIPLESLMEEELFFRYISAKCKKQIARILGQFTFQLPEGITINYENLNTEADAEITKIEEEVKAFKNNGTFLTSW